MEMNEIRYFTAVAETQNIHRASENIGISPSSLSKAISKLEEELKVKLFSRLGRNIILTTEGIYLKEKAHQILNIETQTKLEILGQETTFKAVIGASETLLSHFGIEIAAKIRKQYPKAQIELIPVEESVLIQRINDGEVHLGISTYSPPASIDSKRVSNVKFHTVVGKNHSLYSIAKKGTSIAVGKVLKYDFVTPKKSILGHTNKSKSHDGWRDDKFPRKHTYITSSLNTLNSLIESGQAIAYLPDYFTQTKSFEKLNITGCPHVCKQQVHILTKDKASLGWINHLF
jgi:DNA-binding transcriptional LysR family regulator